MRREEGWLTVHGVSTGRDTIDTVLIGPGGLLTVAVETSSTLQQAHRHKRWLELITGRQADALFVSANATRVDRHDGVIVLPAGMLHGHLRRREQRLDATEVRELHERLAYAFAS